MSMWQPVTLFLMTIEDNLCELHLIDDNLCKFHQKFNFIKRRFSANTISVEILKENLYSFKPFLYKFPYKEKWNLYRRKHLSSCNIIKEETPVQLFPCDFRQIFKNA